MGKTIVEKILARASGSNDAAAGDIVSAKVSFLMTNDAVGELTVKACCGMAKSASAATTEISKPGWDTKTRRSTWHPRRL